MGATVSLDLSSRPEAVTVVDDALALVLEGTPLGEIARHRVRVAAREAVVNAVEHGNRSQPERRVLVEFAVDDRVVEVVVADEGEGFDPALVPDPLAPDNLLSRRGRGLMLMAGCMDQVAFDHRPGGLHTARLRRATDNPREDRMDFARRTRGTVTVIDVTGKVTIGVGEVALREAVRSARDAGSTNILLNMAGTTTIDSSGIGELVASYTETSNRGGTLKLASVPPKVIDMLQITQLLTIFEIYDSEDEAVESFG